MFANIWGHVPTVPPGFYTYAQLHLNVPLLCIVEQSCVMLTTIHLLYVSHNTYTACLLYKPLEFSTAHIYFPVVGQDCGSATIQLMLSLPIIS